MATGTSNDFPLATNDPSVGDAGSETAPGYDEGTAAGASGHSTSSVNISTGGLVAIIIVVVAVAILGGTYSYTRSAWVAQVLSVNSGHGWAVLCCQEARVDDEGNTQEIRPQGGHGSYAQEDGVPRLRQELWGLVS